MKKLIVFALSLFVIFVILSSCSEHLKIETDKPVHIYGKISGSDLDEIKFNVSKQGTIDFKNDIFIAKVNKDGTYSIDIDTYPIAHTWVASGNNSSIAKLYLIPGDSLEMNIKSNEKDEQTEVSFKGKYAKFHSYIKDIRKKFPKDDEFYKYFYKSYDYELSKKYWNNRRDAQLKFFDSIFNNSLLPSLVIREAKNDIMYQWADNRTYYLLYHYFWHPRHDPIKLDGNDYDYLNEILVSNPWSRDSYSYLSFLSNYQNMINHIVVSRWDKHPGFKKSLNAFYYYCIDSLSGISRDIVIAMRLKDVLKYTSDSKNLDTVKMVIDEFGKSVKYKEYHQIALDMYNRRMKMMPGNQAYNFTLHDLNGKSVSLMDLKGKVVYIDIWGIGCGPCIEEIPYTKKLHEELKNETDLIFLGINTNIGHTESVKDFINIRGIPGIHLITDQQQVTLLREKFMYSGIPHYLLIDRKGNFIKASMTRPSDPKTKGILLKALRE